MAPIIERVILEISCAPAWWGTGLNRSVIMAKVLVVDDEPGILNFTRRALESEGYTVVTAGDGAEGLRKAFEQAPDLIVLDLAMPQLSGHGVLAALMAEDPRYRVLVLSAVGDVEARVRCLDLGAVDFLPKPFAVAEFLARVRSRLRQPAVRASSVNELTGGGLKLDVRTRRLSSARHSADLSQREFALMEHLMRRPGVVCSRSELLSEVWGYTFDPGSNVVDVTIARIRAKLPEVTIDTIRNVGYVLRQG
jgi:DNA-binding response OmpR family regulator